MQVMADSLIFRISRYGAPRNEELFALTFLQPSHGINSSYLIWSEFFTVMSQCFFERLPFPGAKEANSSLTPNDKSSPPIATDVGTALDEMLLSLKPAHR